MQNLMTLFQVFLLFFGTNLLSQSDSVWINAVFDGNITGEIGLNVNKQNTSVSFENNISNIHDNKVLFKGTIKYPQATRMILVHDDIEYYSDYFYFSAGRYVWNISVQSDKLIIKSSDPIFNEYNNGLGKLLEVFNQARKNIKNNYGSLTVAEPYHEAKMEAELDEIQKQKKMLLKDFICYHPLSYISLQELYFEVKGLDEYDSLYYDAYNCLDKTLKSTFHGIQIAEVLACGKKLQVGNVFPDFELIDTSGNVHYLYDLPLNKYNLIDFWHSGCGACIQQFPKLQALHDMYGASNLTIFGVSGDIKRTENQWKSLIQKHSLSFGQYWDVDHKQASGCLIKWYPTTFLLNQEGRVLAKNIELEELERLLDKNE